MVKTVHTLLGMVGCCVIVIMFVEYRINSILNHRSASLPERPLSREYRVVPIENDNNWITKGKATVSTMDSAAGFDGDTTLEIGSLTSGAGEEEDESQVAPDGPSERSDQLAFTHPSETSDQPETKPNDPPETKPNDHPETPEEDDNTPLHPDAEFHVVTTFFKGRYSDERINELRVALMQNLNNSYIAKVHMLYEDVDPLTLILDEPSNIKAKLVSAKVARQPTYSELTTYANSTLAPGTPVIICNADIYFDDSLGSVVIDRNPPPDERHIVYALSRHNTPFCRASKGHRMCESYIGSHDSFILMTPIADLVLEKTTHTQNKLGAENLFLFWLKKARYVAKNPCHDIKSFHIHCVKERHIRKGQWVSNISTHARCKPELKHADTWRLV